MNHDVPQAWRGESAADLPSNPYQHGAWDVALVCLGGHLLNDRARGDPSWTERVMSAVRLVIREMAALELHERDQLRRSIDHIIRQTAQTPQAVRQIDDALSRIGGESAQALRELFLSIASADVRAQLVDQG